MLRAIGLRILLILLVVIVGCDYFDDSEDIENPFIDSTPVVIPVDGDWELIATLERNPLDPAMFYVFPEQNELIMEAYLAGKHFIFEIGFDLIHEVADRYYIIQPHAPFQDKHKDPYRVWLDKKKGVKIDAHTFHFLANLPDNWYTSVPDHLEGFNSGKALGLGVDFSVHTWFDNGSKNYGVRIGLLHDSFTIGRGNHFIKEGIRLRIYVSR